MRHPWFNLRLAFVGSLLLLFYVPIFVIAYEMGIPLEYLGLGILLMLVVEYWWGKRRVMASVETRHWDEIDVEAADELEQRVQEHAESMGVSMPELHAGVMGSPNAFAVGRRGSGHVVVSLSLLQLLSLRELEAVMVHELSHLHSRDTIPTLVGEGASRVLMLTLAPIAMIIAILFSSFMSGEATEKRIYHKVELFFLHVGDTLVRYCTFAISRQREFVADADARRELGTGKPLQRALLEISKQFANSEQVSPPEEVETLCISSDWSLSGLGSTHPPMKKRIERLED